MRRALVAVLGSSVLLSLLAAGSAGARPAESTVTIKLGWHERALARGRTVMTFNVRTLSITSRGWTIAASFRNTSRSRLRIREEFALLVAKRRAQIDGAGALQAKSFRPALPAALAPGQGWSGTFSGGGASILHGVFVRAHFSYFRGPVIPGQAGFGWITDHVVRLR
jgi:hypothetical protein